MSTPRRWSIIPAVTLAIVAAASCSSDDDKSSSSPATAASSASDAAPPPSVAETLAVVDGETIPPTDASLSADTLAPDAFDALITAIVGIDTSADRVENVALGSNVTLVLTNPDAKDEFHVHGYELGDGEEVDAGESKTFYFTADQAGEFEVESHTTETVLLTIVVA